MKLEAYAGLFFLGR